MDVRIMGSPCPKCGGCDYYCAACYDDWVVLGHALNALARRKVMDEEKVLEVLRQVEWVGLYERPYCPWCMARKTQGHDDACKLDALLREAEDDASNDVGLCA